MPQPDHPAFIDTSECPTDSNAPETDSRRSTVAFLTTFTLIVTLSGLFGLFGVQYFGWPTIWMGVAFAYQSVICGLLLHIIYD